MTLKAVAAKIGRTHANLLHHFGSAAGLQAALARSIAEPGHRRASPKPSSAPAPAKPTPARSSTGTFDAFGREGAGSARRLDDPDRQPRRARPDPRPIRASSTSCASGHEEHHVGETTLWLVLAALGDSLLGAPIAEALGLHRDTARETGCGARYALSSMPQHPRRLRWQSGASAY